MIVSSPIGQECSLPMKKIRCLYSGTRGSTTHGRVRVRRRRGNVELAPTSIVTLPAESALAPSSHPSSTSSKSSSRSFFPRYQFPDTYDLAFFRYDSRQKHFFSPSLIHLRPCTLKYSHAGISSLRWHLFQQLLAQRDIYRRALQQITSNVLHRRRYNTRLHWHRRIIVLRAPFRQEPGANSGET